jgi:hypothetical protein
MTSTNDTGDSNDDQRERDPEGEHERLCVQGLHLRQRLRLPELRLQARVRGER